MQVPPAIIAIALAREALPLELEDPIAVARKFLDDISPTGSAAEKRRHLVVAAAHLALAITRIDDRWP
jgi:hypothetical protein